MVKEFMTPSTTAIGRPKAARRPLLPYKVIQIYETGVK
jgi:hypothetical protein